MSVKGSSKQTISSLTVDMVNYDDRTRRYIQSISSSAVMFNSP